MGIISRDEAPIEHPDSPDLRKGVLFIQFDIPSETATAKQAEVQAYVDVNGGLPGGFNAVLFGVIPFFTWGPQQTATEYTWGTSTITIDTYPGGHSDVVLSVITGSTSKETPPSHVGVFVDNTGEMSLIVHIQTQNSSSCSNTLSVGSGAHWDPPGAPAGSGSIVIDYADASYIDEAKPEYFGNAGIAPSDGSDRADFNRPVIIGTDTPHTLILSWDITDGSESHGVVSTDPEIGTSAGADVVSKMWCAIDDVNKSGTDLPAMWAHIDTEAGDPNEMLSFIAASVSGNHGGETGTPSVLLTTDANSVPFYPVAVPSKESLLREGVSFIPNPKVRIKRIQLFDGVTLDTSVEDNRRIFIDGDNQPVASLETARSFFGRTPVVEFDGVSTFVAGANGGTAGSFTKDGTITAYPP